MRSPMHPSRFRSLLAALLGTRDASDDQHVEAAAKLLGRTAPKSDAIEPLERRLAALVDQPADADRADVLLALWRGASRHAAPESNSATLDDGVTLIERAFLAGRVPEASLSDWFALARRGGPAAVRACLDSLPPSAGAPAATQPACPAPSPTAQKGNPMSSHELTAADSARIKHGISGPVTFSFKAEELDAAGADPYRTNRGETAVTLSVEDLVAAKQLRLNPRDVALNKAVQPTHQR